ncbi:MAG: putative toxin-antitoxin system toxin component, PIN family [Burkholderiales bacterium]|nr:putative toxin-antitoxin system toxin component, PIN family [Burkholderiales bacterium]
MRPPRVVLDTNAALSALVFLAGPAARLRVGWQSGRFVPLASTATALELTRVLAYPKFGLEAALQDELLADYLPWVEVVALGVPPPDVPLCRDPADKPFLELAIAGGAAVLVSGDRDLVDLARVSRTCPIMSVATFCDRHM